MLSLATHLPAYPHMLEEFQLTAGSAVWMQLGLALGLTGFQPLLGWCGDAFGIKGVILMGALFMVVGSVLVALSPAFWLLVVGLFFKGLAGAAIAPAGVAYAGTLFTGKQRGRSIGLFTSIMTIGALFGPLLSGSFVDLFGWDSTFWVTALFGMIAFFLFWLGVPNVETPGTRKLDVMGLLFVLIVLVGILTIPTFINRYGFSSGSWLPSLAIFAIGLFSLIIIERKQRYPLLDIKYAANKNFWVPTLIAGLIFVGYSGVMYLLTFFVQDIQGKSATTVGFLQMAIFLGSAGAAIISGKIMGRFTVRKMLGGGITLFALGLIMLIAVNILTSNLHLFISMILIGVGSGSLAPVLKSIVVSKADTARINVVTFTNTVIENVAQRLGASFALVVFTMFAAKGDGVSAISNTTWIYIALVAVSLILLLLIPKRIEGIHKDHTTSSRVEEIKGTEKAR
ncbi:MFS transporter [Virgibacillus massiliensis]|nr:MFS transporter [Virgibacillus massiliensis]